MLNDSYITLTRKLHGLMHEGEANSSRDSTRLALAHALSVIETVFGLARVR